MFYRATRERRRDAAPLSAAPDADLLCGPVKHLYQLTRGELAACPVAVGIAKTKPRGSGERAQRDRNVNAKWQVRWVQRSAWIRPLSISPACSKVPHLNKPFNILFPSINKTTRWLIITRHILTRYAGARTRVKCEIHHACRFALRLIAASSSDRIAITISEFSSCN